MGSGALHRAYLNSNGRVEVTTAPAAEPVSTATAKEWIRLESGVTADDTLIDGLVTAARVWVERYIQRKLITQTIRQTLDDWPNASQTRDLPREGRISDAISGDAAYVELLASPVQSITSVTTYNDSDTATTWSSSNYRLSASGDRARIVPVGSASWPTATRNSDGVEIVYQAGYGDAASDVPEAIVTAVKFLVAHWYENRGDMEATKAPEMVKMLLASYRIREL